MSYYEAGETYYFDVYIYSGEGTFKVMLDRIIHTADDGTEHTDITHVEKTYSNCTEHGYTEGLYCNECEEYVYGHEELPIELGDHIDDDFDEICDLCGESVYCEHLCHSDNWFLSFIWSIVNFFQRIFGTNPICGCGDAHY